MSLFGFLARFCMGAACMCEEASAMYYTTPLPELLLFTDAINNKVMAHTLCIRLKHFQVE